MAVRCLVTHPINGFQYDALVSFCYNCGEGNLKKSTLLRYVNEGKFEEASKEFIKWNKANGKVLPVEPRHLNIRDSNTDYFAYDRDKQLVISFPNLEIGDVIDIESRFRCESFDGNRGRQLLVGLAHQAQALQHLLRQRTVAT